MERTQIQLEPEQARALKERAAEQGVSVAAVVRDAVTAYLAGGDTDERIKRALAAGGAFSSGLPDVGEQHDRYLAEDFGA